VGEALFYGWPKDNAELSRWLDLMWSGSWRKHIERAARLPLGIVEDPRDAFYGDFENQDTLNRHMYSEIGTLIGARALQLQKTDSAGALYQIETRLGLSRQLRNHAPSGLEMLGFGMERGALWSYYQWLKHAGPDSDALKKGLALLQHHEALRPDSVDPVKAQYFVFENTISNKFSSLPPYIFTHSKTVNATAVRIWEVVWSCPWERARQQRLTNMIYWLRLHPDGPAPWRRRDELSFRSAPANDLRRLGLTQEQLKEMLSHAWSSTYELGPLQGLLPPFSVVPLHADEIVTALMLYIADNNKAPEKLKELVPHYLPKLPDDPINERPFEYRISQGEKITTDDGQVNLRKGQAVVWSEGFHGHKWWFPVPLWDKR
jgi:hypothetical protein